MMRRASRPDAFRFRPRDWLTGLAYLPTSSGPIDHIDGMT